MIKKISIKTKFGWLTAYENKEKIFKIKYGKEKKQSQSTTLAIFRRNLNEFFCKKTQTINIPHKIEGNKSQQITQIGNAVPPELASVLANAIKEIL